VRCSIVLAFDRSACGVGDVELVRYPSYGATAAAPEQHTSSCFTARHSRSHVDTFTDIIEDGIGIGWCFGWSTSREIDFGWSTTCHARRGEATGATDDAAGGITPGSGGEEEEQVKVDAGEGGHVAMGGEVDD
jgi:hypothetical protein